jgi:hypothetical protein
LIVFTKVDPHFAVTSGMNFCMWRRDRTSVAAKSTFTETDPGLAISASRIAPK